MQYRALKEQDVGVLTRIFSIPEYDMYFAENDTTEEEWKERLPLFETEHSYIVSEHGSDIGWIMYSICGAICSVDIVVLLPKERNKGYGKAIFQDLMARHPQIKTIKLDVQQRNLSAIRFYQKLGFQIAGEETQSVNGERVPYFNMVLEL